MKTTPLSTRILMLLVALGVAAYFGYQALRYLDDPLTTTMAYTYTVDKVIDVSGYVVRSERVLEDNPSHYTAKYGAAKSGGRAGRRGRHGGGGVRRSGLFRPPGSD